MITSAYVLLHQDPNQPAHGRTLFGEIHELRPTLQVYNEMGYSVYRTVNYTDGKGRKRENIVDARWFFADYDKGLPVDMPLTPSLLLSSSPGKFQAYWEIEGGTKDFALWERIERALVKRTGADENAQDLARILRVPGFWNHKYSPPVKVAIVRDTTNVYSLERCREAFGELGGQASCGTGVVEEALWPSVPVRVMRWTRWLRTQPWPTPGNRNGTLFIWACKGAREFAVPEDETIEVLEHLWWENEPGGDGRIEQLVQNALRSGRAAFGAMYAQPGFAMDEREDEA